MVVININAVNTKLCCFCGEPVPGFNPKECTNCWEVRHRLDDFLQMKVNRDEVRKLLSQYNDGPADSVSVAISHHSLEE